MISSYLFKLQGEDMISSNLFKLQGEDTYDEYYEHELVEMSGDFNSKLSDNVEPLNNDAAAEAAADLALSAIRSGRRNRGTPSKHHDYEKIAGPSTEGVPPRYLF